MQQLYKVSIVWCCVQVPDIPLLLLYDIIWWTNVTRLQLDI